MYNPLYTQKGIITIKHFSVVSFGFGYHSAAALGHDVRWQVGFVVEYRDDLSALVSVFIEAKGVDTLLRNPRSFTQRVCSERLKDYALWMEP